MSFHLVVLWYNIDTLFETIIVCLMHCSLPPTHLKPNIWCQMVGEHCPRISIYTLAMLCSWSSNFLHYSLRSIFQSSINTALARLGGRSGSIFQSSVNTALARLGGRSVTNVGRLSSTSPVQNSPTPAYAHVMYSPMAFIVHVKVCWLMLIHWSHRCAP